MRSLALFDFDGTLTSRDRLADFIMYAKGTRKMIAGFAFLLPVLLKYKLNLIDNDKAKEHVIQHFFQGYDVETLTSIGEIYARERIPEILCPAAVERMNWHLENNHDIYVVTASPEIWVKAWTEDLGIGLIGTLLEVQNRKCTGRFDGRNCHGPEKVKRIKQNIILNKYKKIYAYGDSSGDRPMLELAHEAFYKKWPH
jgi:HAD superfamily hydrolase (TIGR01490 family)